MMPGEETSMSIGLPVLQEQFDLLTIGRSMPRERRQSGWVEKTGIKAKTWTGYWYEYVQVNGAEKRRERSKVLGRCADLTKGGAEAKLLDVIRGWRPREVGATFEQLSLWYLKTNEGLWGKSWNATVTAMFRYQINPRLGMATAAELKRSDIQQAMNSIASDPKSQSESIIQKCLTQIRAVYNFAIEDELLEKNPALKVELPPSRAAESKYLSLAECQRLLEVGSRRDQLIVRLFMVCGLRPSELFALRVDDIGDSQFGIASYLRIDETIVRCHVSFRTKTKGSRATVPLSLELESDLRLYALEEKLVGTDFLFPSSTGTAVSPDNFLDRVLQPLAKLAGISHLTHQILRRTTATHFQKHGTVKDTQALLRHSNANTTMKHYQKVIEESVSEGVQSWDESLLKKRGGRATVIRFPKKVANE